MSYPAASRADGRLEARRSLLGGVGGFAAARIAAGETLLVLGGRALSRAEMERRLAEYVAAGKHFNSMQVEEGLHLHLEDELPCLQPLLRLERLWRTR